MAGQPPPYNQPGGKVWPPPPAPGFNLPAGTFYPQHPPQPPHAPQRQPAPQPLPIHAGLVAATSGQVPVQRYFHIRNERDGTVLCCSGNNRQPGTMAVTRARQLPPADYQLWFLDQQGVVRSKLTHYCLQPSGHGIWLQPFHNQPNQLWIPDGKQLQLRTKPGLCLEQRDNGNKVAMSKYKGAAHQHWLLDYIN